MAETENLILKLKNMFKNLKGWFYLYYVNVRKEEIKRGKREKHGTIEKRQERERYKLEGGRTLKRSKYLYKKNLNTFTTVFIFLIH